jgi:hypothetical protein
MIAMIGALVFLGCPWRVILRLAGGDGNALFGLLGLIAGVWIGTLFFKSGFNLGRSHSQSTCTGLLLPLIMLGLLALRIVFPPIAGEAQSGVSGIRSRVPAPLTRRWRSPWRPALASVSWPSAAVSAPWAPFVMSCFSGSGTSCSVFWRFWPRLW